MLLDVHIAGFEEESKRLTWEKRIKIAFGAAKGLESLHRVCIYGSMRPGNILITHDYHPFVRLINTSTCLILLQYSKFD